MSNTLTKHFFEIRFKPKPSILDKRGRITEKLIGDPFNGWTISENTINFNNKDDKFITGYFSFRNLGFALTQTKSDNYFVDKYRSFITNACTLFNINDITRVGIRTSFYSETDDFEITRVKLQSKIFKEDCNNFNDLGEAIVDVGFAIDFSDQSNFINTEFGPMKKEQAEQRLGKEEDGLYEQGLFLGVDYHISNCKRIKHHKDIIRFIELGLEKSTAINNQLLQWLE